MFFNCLECRNGVFTVYLRLNPKMQDLNEK